MVGPYEDAAAHLREGFQTALRIGSRSRLLDDLDCCGHLCAMTGCCAEAATMWAAVVTLQGRDGFSVLSHPDMPEDWFQRQEPPSAIRPDAGAAPISPASPSLPAWSDARHQACG